MTGEARSKRAIAVIAATAGIATALLVLAPRAVTAQEPAAATTPDKELQVAKAEFEEAQTLFVKDQYDAAAQKFLGAYGHKPFAAFLFNAAVAYEKGQKLPQAA